jgi:hypothetical protein
MRTMIATLAGLVALTSVSAQAVPLAPAKAIPAPIWSQPLNRAGPARLRLGLASRRVARPLGLLALGRLLPELVISAGRCDPAHSVDDINWSDVALQVSLRC